jgi:hypothetical protein
LTQAGARGIVTVMLARARCLPLVLAAGCGAFTAAPENPPAPGFDLAGSDPHAVALADEVMRALGGRAAWDDVRVLRFNFFGRRRHVWDKWTGDVRVEEGDRVVLMNVDTGRGRAFEKGVEVADAAALAAALDRAKKQWVNDTYWLVMPFKLKDTGVTLRYGGQAELAAGRVADVLVLTFAGVGFTPQNKYEVLVDRDTKLVAEWRWFERATDPTPKLVTPWAGWRDCDGILLAGDRGPGRELTEITALRRRLGPFAPALAEP